MLRGCLGAMLRRALQAFSLPPARSFHAQPGIKYCNGALAATINTVAVKAARQLSSHRTRPFYQDGRNTRWGQLTHRPTALPTVLTKVRATAGRPGTNWQCAGGGVAAP